MSACDAVDGSPQRHRYMPTHESSGLKIRYILAFSERLLLAKPGRPRHPSIASALTPKAVMNAPMSAIGGKADVVCHSNILGPIPEGGDPCDTAYICDAFGIELVAKARRSSPYPGQSAVCGWNCDQANQNA